MALYGISSLFIILAGLTWGFVSTSRTEQLERDAHTNDLQWKQLSELNNKLITLESETRQTRKYLDDQESRIRALEHHGERR
jgi:hypothetical protein